MRPRPRHSFCLSGFDSGGGSDFAVPPERGHSAEDGGACHPRAIKRRTGSLLKKRSGVNLVMLPERPKFRDGVDRTWGRGFANMGLDVVRSRGGGTIVTLEGWFCSIVQGSGQDGMERG